MDMMMIAALNGWAELNRVISSFSEEQINTMLEHELANKRRKTFVRRIHERLTTMRTKREREELLNGLKGD